MRAATFTLGVIKLCGLPVRTLARPLHLVGQRQEAVANVGLEVQHGNRREQLVAISGDGREPVPDLRNLTVESHVPVGPAVDIVWS